MKRSLTVLAASFLCITAFAQGKVGFNNDSLHLVYWGPSLGTYYGSAVNSDNMPPGIPGLQVDLYLGTSSSLLSLTSSTTFGPLAAGPGKWASTSVTVPTIPTGTTVFVEIGVHSTEKAPTSIFDDAALQTFYAHGSSVEFSYTLGGPITYPPLWSPTQGTWPPGGFPMDQYGSGARGAIQVDIPEPSTLALAGLGAAAMLIFRRRK